MGFAFTVIFFFFVGLLVIMGWASIDALCNCAPMAPGQGNGIMGIAVVTGCVVGAGLTVISS